jgi:hypothetical protein
MTAARRLLLLASRAGTPGSIAASLRRSSPLHHTRALSSLNSSQGQQQQGQHSSSSTRAAWGLSAAAAAMLLLTSGTSLADAKRAAKLNAKVEQQQQQQQQAKGAPAAASPDSLPEYTADEVAQHRTPQDRVWVTYKDGVYDITDFIAQVSRCVRHRAGVWMACMQHGAVCPSHCSRCVPPASTRAHAPSCCRYTAVIMQLLCDMSAVATLLLLPCIPNMRPAAPWRSSKNHAGR